jgi:hypothetical protein
MACKTESRFDQLSKIVASGLPRREVFKYVGAATIGAMLASMGVRKAEAANVCKGCPGCPNGVSCKTAPNGTLCYCFQKAKNPAKCKCLGDFFCPGVACTSNKDCKTQLGQGAKCIATSCCGVQSCAPACGNGILAAQSGAKASGT